MQRMKHDDQPALGSVLISRIGPFARHQSDVLIAGVDKYLYWRQHKDDNIGLVTSLFTKLRHFPVFGENRATSLRLKLASYSDNPLDILKNYFNENSLLRNHSLDTYLVNTIVQHKELFKIPQDLFDQGDIDGRLLQENIRVYFSRKPDSGYGLQSENDYAYDVAKSYEITPLIDNHIQKSLFYYGLIINEYAPALKALTSLAKAGNSEAQYYLGFEYYHRKREYITAIKWCIMAVENQHPGARTYLMETDFHAEQYLMIAEIYDAGKVVKPNMELAIYFYKKAYQLNSMDAAFRLGEIYQPALIVHESSKKELNTMNNAKIALEYYIVAMNQRDERALHRVVEIIEYYNQDDWRFWLAEIYLNVFTKKMLAFIELKRLADNNYHKAIEQLRSLAINNPNHAYSIAKLYEENNSNIQISCDYYSIAIRHNHSASIAALRLLAMRDHSEAQYVLGLEYDRHQNLLGAVSCCMLAAENNHSKALTYLATAKLTGELYFEIARRFEICRRVKDHMVLAVQFYEKARHLNHTEAIFRLGELYLPPEISKDSSNQRTDTKPNAKMSFDYFAILVHQKHERALQKCIEIIEYCNNDELWFWLAMTYLNIFGNQGIALAGLKKLADKNYQAALDELITLAKKNPEYAYSIAKLYEGDNRNIQIVCDYYVMAIKNNHPGSIEALRLLAMQGHSEAQYVLGFEYYRHHNILETADWCMRAAETNHKKALEYLTTAKFTGKMYFKIARRFELCNWVKDHMELAVQFYEKACHLNHAEAIFRLGELYLPPEISKDSSNKITGITPNEKTSFDYFAILVDQKSERAFQKCIEIVEHYNKNALWFWLAMTYLNCFDNPGLALTILKKLADKNYQAAIDHLKTLAMNNPEHAYSIAKLYEGDNKDIQIVCDYYTMAIKHNHAASIKSLRLLAMQGYSEAQYALGFDYYRHQNLSEAVDWCMRAAEFNHQKALEYLATAQFTGEMYFAIAKRFELCSRVKDHMALAVRYYEKARHLNHTEAIFRLGELHLHPEVYKDSSNIITGITPNTKTAFDCFAILAYQKHEQALQKIIKMIEFYDIDELWFWLAMTHLNVYGNPELALRGLKKLAEKNYQAAIDQLKTLAINNPDHAYSIARLYEGESGNIQIAYDYYAIAIQHNHPASIEALRLLGIQGHSEAQYVLGFEYYRYHNILEAVDWCLLAAENNHPKAIKEIKYLASANLTGEMYFEIARRFELSSRIKDYMALAVQFYERSSHLKHTEATFRLGVLHLPPEISKDSSNKIIDIKLSAQVAFDYFAILVHQKHERALQKIIEIIEYCNKDELWFWLAMTHLNVYGNQDLALAGLKKLADNNYQAAIEKLRKLAINNPDHAYSIARLYEGNSGNIQIACDYYTIAIKINHSASIDALRLLAIQGNSEAQYVLGFEYYRHHSLLEAVDWCLRAAEDNHPKAINAIKYLATAKLSGEMYFEIARRFELSSRVKDHMALAVQFYEKARHLKHTEATFHLAELHLPTEISKDSINKISDIEPNAQLSFDYLAILVHQKHERALQKIIAIIEYYDKDELWFWLAMTHLNVYGNQELALTDLKKLADKNYQEAKDQLRTLAIINSAHSYLIAELYENDQNPYDYKVMAFYFYMIGMQNDKDVTRKFSIHSKLQTNLETDYLTELEMNKIGEMHHYAIDGIIQDYETAMLFYTKAAKNGCNESYYNLGNMYRYGHGVKPDVIKALRYYQLAEKNGSVLATKQIEQMIASKEISPKQAVSIALMYQEGDKNLDKDGRRALMFFKKGGRSANLLLGQFHQVDHDGIPKDVVLTFEAYLRAANLGEHDALDPLERLGEEVSPKHQLALSQVYETCFHNIEKADYWRNKAMEVTQFSP